VERLIGDAVFCDFCGVATRKECEFHIWKSRSYDVQQGKTRASVKFERSVEWLSRLEHSMTCEVGKLTASEALEYGGGRGFSGDKTANGKLSLQRSPYHLDLSVHTWKQVVWLGNEE
jgi:hypothetical protein